MTTQDQIATSKKVELTLTLPSVNWQALLQKITAYLSSIYRPISNQTEKASSSAISKAKGFKMPNFKNKFYFNKNNMKFIFPAVIGVVVIIAVVSIVRSLPDAQSRPVSESKIASQDAVATLNLDKKFNFPLLDGAGKEVGTFEYVIQSASLQRQIVVQGQRANAIQGRIFLILNLKITNSEKQTISLNTRDYLRLVVKSNTNEQLAPDIHNDPVEVQAISTKYTRVGVAVNEEDAKKLIQLKVGEINGEKQTIDLNFKY